MSGLKSMVGKTFTLHNRPILIADCFASDDGVWFDIQYLDDFLSSMQVISAVDADLLAAMAAKEDPAPGERLYTGQDFTATRELAHRIFAGTAELEDGRHIYMISYHRKRLEGFAIYSQLSPEEYEKFLSAPQGTTYEREDLVRLACRTGLCVEYRDTVTPYTLADVKPEWIVK